MLAVLISYTQLKTKAAIQLRYTKGKNEEDNKNVILCYFKSNPRQKGYKKL